jgi:hypothetical protein
MDWYYVNDGEKQGPVTGTDLRQLAKEGVLLPEDHVWRDGMPDWILARKVRGLFGESRDVVKIPTPPDAEQNEPTGASEPEHSSHQDLETPFKPDEAKEAPSPQDDSTPRKNRAVRDIVLPEIISNKSPEALPQASLEPSKQNETSSPVQINTEEEKPGRKATESVGPVLINPRRGRTPPQEDESTQEPAPAHPVETAIPVTTLELAETDPPEAAPPTVAAPPVVSSVEPTAPKGTTPPADDALEGGAQTKTAYKDAAERGELTHLFDFLLTGICNIITPPFVEASCRLLLTVGHYGLYAAMLIAFMTGVIFAVQTQVYAFIGVGLVLAIALLVLQFVGTRFSEALESLVRGSESKIHSTVLLDALAFLFLAIGCVILLAAGLSILTAGSLGGIQGILSVVGGLLVGMTWFVVFLFAAAASLCPESVNVTEESASTAGEQALGLYGFLANLLARTTVVLYGSGVALGTLGLIIALAISLTSDSSATAEPNVDSSGDAYIDSGDLIFTDEAPEEESESFIAELGFGAALTASLYLVISAACAPAFVYLGLLVVMLQISVIRAILSVGKRPFEVCLPSEANEPDEGADSDR